jgi:hypothetical protein
LDVHPGAGATKGRLKPCLQPWTGTSVGQCMPSTVIRRFSYSSDSRELVVEFVSGRRYLYSQVPPELVERMRGAFAKGVYFNRNIRDKHPYRELA